MCAICAGSDRYEVASKNRSCQLGDFLLDLGLKSGDADISVVFCEIRANDGIYAYVSAR